MLRKLLFNTLGIFFVGCGIAGIILPLVPATPFLLLAAACFVRGSDRLHAWLIDHRILGAPIRHFREGKGMPRRAKQIAIPLLWISILISIHRLDITWLRVLLALTAVGVTLLILRIPTYVPEEEESDRVEA